MCRSFMSSSSISYINWIKFWNSFCVREILTVLWLKMLKVLCLWVLSFCFADTFSDSHSRFLTDDHTCIGSRIFFFLFGKYPHCRDPIFRSSSLHLVQDESLSKMFTPVLVVVKIFFTFPRQYQKEVVFLYPPNNCCRRHGIVTNRFSVAV